MAERIMYEFGAFRFDAELCLLMRLDNKDVRILKRKQESAGRLGKSLCPLLLAFLSRVAEYGSNEVILTEEDLINAAWPKRNSDIQTAKGTLRRTLSNLKMILKNNDTKERPYIESKGGAHKFLFTVEKKSAEEIMNPRLPAIDRESLKKANELYAWGRRKLDTFTTKDGLQKAIAHFRQACEIVPYFAAAYAHEALAHAWLSIFSWSAPEDSLPEVLRQAGLALYWDKNLGVAHAAKAFAILFSEPKPAERWKKAEALICKAIELDEKYDQKFEAVYQVKALMQIGRGQLREANQTINRSLEIKPVSFISNVLKALVLFLSRDYRSCDDLLQEILSEDPHMDAAYYIRVLVYIYMGDADKALKEIEQGETMGGGNILYRLLSAYWKAMWDSEDEAIKLLEELDKESERRYISPYHRALPYVYIDKQRAIERLEQAALAQDPWVLMLKVDPRIDLLRRNRRFIRLLYRLGLDFGQN